MIIDPDFLDHWRTRMVVDALDGDEMAPMYIMRLWGHCQRRKDDAFKMPPAGLKAQCRYAGDAAAFEKALSEAGFVERDGDTIRVLGWAEKNASLLAAWDNGHKGGRPKKNPDETHGKPTGNPAVTHGEPSANPDGTQTKPIRVEKRREEHSVPSGTGAGAPPEPGDVIFALGVPALTAAGVSDRNARSMLGLMRKQHGDATVIDAIQRCAEEKPLQPVAWLQAALKARDSPKPRKSDALMAGNIAVAQRYLSGGTQ
jgi:hypothetical protein